MSEPNGQEALLSAFDRLFERAASKLHLECTSDELAEAKRHFVERYQDALRLVDQADLPAIPDPVLARMEEAIDQLPAAYIAAQVATGPLALYVQEAMRQVAVRAAERRMVEHLANRADDRYGGH